MKGKHQKSVIARQKRLESEQVAELEAVVKALQSDLVAERKHAKRNLKIALAEETQRAKAATAAQLRDEIRRAQLAEATAIHRARRAVEVLIDAYRRGGGGTPTLLPAEYEEMHALLGDINHLFGAYGLDEGNRTRRRVRRRGLASLLETPP